MALKERQTSTHLRWHLVARAGDLIALVYPGMRLGEDANGCFSLEPAHALVELGVENDFLIVRLLPRPGESEVPPVYVDSTTRIHVTFPNESFVIDPKWASDQSGADVADSIEIQIRPQARIVRDTATSTPGSSRAGLTRRRAVFRLPAASSTDYVFGGLAVALVVMIAAVLFLSEPAPETPNAPPVQSADTQTDPETAQSVETAEPQTLVPDIASPDPEPVATASTPSATSNAVSDDAEPIQTTATADAPAPGAEPASAETSEVEAAPPFVVNEPEAVERVDAVDVAEEPVAPAEISSAAETAEVVEMVGVAEVVELLDSPQVETVESSEFAEIADAPDPDPVEFADQPALVEPEYEPEIVEPAVAEAAEIVEPEVAEDIDAAAAGSELPQDDQVATTELSPYDEAFYEPLDESLSEPLAAPLVSTGRFVDEPYDSEFVPGQSLSTLPLVNGDAAAETDLPAPGNDGLDPSPDLVLLGRSEPGTAPVEAPSAPAEPQLPSAAEPAADESEQLYSFSDLTVVRQIAPDFPRTAPSGASGVVDLEFTVSARGRVEDLQVQNDAPAYFARSAKNAVSKWRFKAVVVEGKRVPVRTRLRLTFRGG